MRLTALAARAGSDATVKMVSATMIKADRGSRSARFQRRLEVC